MKEYVRKVQAMKILHFGALAPKLKEQLKEFMVLPDDLEHAQLDADAITRLSIRGLITGSETLKARRKLGQKLDKAIIE